MAVQTRASAPSLLWPGIKALFGSSYNEHSPEWSAIFKKGTSDKASEKLVEMTGLGLGQIKPEGASIGYDTSGEGITNVLQHLVFALGYIVSREALEDDQYEEVASRNATQLGFSMRQTAEIVHANVLNRAFNPAYAYGDGQALLSATHQTVAGNQSNLLVAADLSEAGIEDLVKTISRMTNSRGLAIGAMLKQLIIHPDEMFNAERILKSQLRVNTANNDINALRTMGSVPTVVMNHFLTKTDAWFGQTDVPQGLQSLWRREVQIEKEKEFDNDNEKTKASMRFAVGFGDWRCLYGSNGS